MPKRVSEFQNFMIDIYPELAKANEGDVAARNITLCVTNDCQLRCTYCYERHKGEKYMTFETAKKYIDLLISGEKVYWWRATSSSRFNR